MNFNIRPQKICYFFYLKLIVLMIVSAVSGQASEIIRYFADQNLSFQTRIKFSLKFAYNTLDGKKIWIIYSIDSSADLSKIEFPTPHSQNTSQTLDQIINDNAHGLAIILNYSLESGRPRLYGVLFQSFDQPFMEELRPIIWLGHNQSTQSLAWLKQQFYKTNYSKLKHQIIKVIGVHDCSQKIVAFYKLLLRGHYPWSLKNETIFWLGQHNTKESIKLLALIALKQKDVRLRKKAIFALSQINDRSAQAVVCTLAKKGYNREIKQEAIFWLSQMDDPRAIATLKEIVTTEKDPELKEYAIFAISQLPEEKAGPILTQLSQTSPYPRVRKKAIFWLEHTDDQRILDFLFELTKEDDLEGLSK